MKLLKQLPVEVIFNPRWWHLNAGINFDEAFFFDKTRRVEDEQKMRKYLHERFQIDGLGEKDSVKKPVIGPVHLAAGFLIPMLFGCNVTYHIDGPPDVIPLNLCDEEVMKLKVPDLKTTYPISKLIEMMNELEMEYGYLEGDADWSGVLNHALDIRGNQIFMDMYDDSKAADHLFEILSLTVLDFTKLLLKRTGSTSISVNPQTRNFNPKINLHSNCSVSMISNDMYEDKLLKYDRFLAKHLQPYGIHHCGDNMDRVAKGYSKVQDVSFFDVGYGSDVKKCREILPDAFFNLRLSPVKMLHDTAAQVRDDILRLVEQNGGIENAGLCCINMDYGTPDENIRTIYDTAAELRGK